MLYVPSQSKMTGLLQTFIQTGILLVHYSRDMLIMNSNLWNDMLSNLNGHNLFGTRILVSLFPRSAISLPALCRRLTGDLSDSWTDRCPYFVKAYLSGYDSIKYATKMAKMYVFYEDNCTIFVNPNFANGQGWMRYLTKPGSSFLLLRCLPSARESLIARLISHSARKSIHDAPHSFHRAGNSSCPKKGLSTALGGQSRTRVSWPLNNKSCGASGGVGV